MTNERRSIFRHPLSAIAGALFLAGGFLFTILLLLDFSAKSDNPYRALVTFIIAPAIITGGALLFVISTWLQVRKARKRGQKLRFRFYIDPTDPAYMRNLWRFLGISAALILLVAYSGRRAYDATDSVSFCGETCHEVMEPQFVTYQNSPHAQVPCVDCHIGPGASFYVQSKLDGTRQLFATALNTYSRPIETPVENLRPAQETCEECHWPQQFYGQKYVNHTYYRTDEENSPWTINMLVKIGGGNPRSGKQEGIHWHMITADTVEYVANDRKRQEIPWVRLIRANGDTVIYTNPETDQPDFDNPETEIRRFDCMDCHNRPSHYFKAPAAALNLALSIREISPELPYIRQVGLDLLNDDYDTRTEAHDAIRHSLPGYYAEKYPEVAKNSATEIKQAVKAILGIYDNNFFPEMKTDYRARENNLSHFVNDGCFRCHNGIMQDSNGNNIANDCKTCHLIVAQGPSEQLADLETNLEGLDFHHPEDIEEMWKEALCTDCHTSDQGY